jgi:phosphohistidine swiveling domain-containing protein
VLPWLRAVRAKSRHANAAANTEATYRHHLAKLRWYVEQVSGVTPSRWSMQEVDHFTAFLAQVPEGAIGERGLAADDTGWRPFRCQPSAGSQADLRRFVHALFNAWHKTGYLRHNPMALHGAGVARSVNVSRALRPELVDLMIDQLTQEPTENFTQRQSAVRDTFILLALHGLGLRASELIQSRMCAFYPLSVPATGAIVTGGVRWQPMLERLAHMLGYGAALAGIHTVTPSGAQLAQDPVAARILLTQACQQAMQTCDAQAIILGGAGLAGMAAAIQAQVAVPVIDSVLAGTRQAVLLAGQKTHEGSNRFDVQWQRLSPELTALGR